MDTLDELEKTTLELWSETAADTKEEKFYRGIQTVINRIRKIESQVYSEGSSKKAGRPAVDGATLDMRDMTADERESFAELVREGNETLFSKDGFFLTIDETDGRLNIYRKTDPDAIIHQVVYTR